MRMRTVLRGLFALSVLTLCFSLVSCDSGGSNSGPAWVGNWRVSDFGGGQGAPADPNYWSITTGELEVVEDFGSGCDIATYEVINREDGRVEFRGTSSDEEGETLEFQFNVTGETLTATLLDASDESEAENEGNELTLRKLDGNPREIADCS